MSGASAWNVGMTMLGLDCLVQNQGSRAGMGGEDLILRGFQELDFISLTYFVASFSLLLACSFATLNVLAHLLDLMLLRVPCALFCLLTLLLMSAVFARLLIQERSTSKTLHVRAPLAS